MIMVFLVHGRGVFWRLGRTAPRRLLASFGSALPCLGCFHMESAWPLGVFSGFTDAKMEGIMTLDSHHEE